MSETTGGFPSRSTVSACCAASLSVFFPAYNDARSVAALVRTTFDVLRRRLQDYEVIVVNDGSTDATGAVLEQLREEYAPFLRVITHGSNRGYGGALRSGFAASTKEWVFYTDGDGQYDPAELDRLLDQAEPGVGLVNGYKLARRDPWHRIAIGWLYNNFARGLFGITLRDIDCDFRLIRRSLLSELNLRSTTGTICVELVRGLERSGMEIREVPVHHYPRLHGRSQFFRTKSLLLTFFQLMRLFVSVLAHGRTLDPWKPSTAQMSVTFVLLAILSLLTYARALQLPFIADDYVQIQLGRDYGAFSGWKALAQDALYRCRATSLVMTYWTEKAFGLDPFVFNCTSLGVHILNSFLVFLLGIWRIIGWRISTVAAFLFAIDQHHQEAVMWYAALPELLVFTFTIGSFLVWLRWTQSGGLYRYAFSFLLFLMALLSKESAVVLLPLIGCALFLDRRWSWRKWSGIMPFAIAAVVYFSLAYAQRSNHLHFNDGTFSLHAPFWRALINSVGRLLWVWGIVSVLALAYWRAWRWRTVLLVGGMWMVLTLLPYSFLMYMPRVPSRHTYFASVGLSFIVAAAALELRDRGRSPRAIPIFAALACIIVIHQAGYIWTKKHAQFTLRAEPTERLIKLVHDASGPVYVSCFPYDESVATYAVQQRVASASWRPVMVGSASAGYPEAVDLCNAATGRGRQ